MGAGQPIGSFGIAQHVERIRSLIDSFTAKIMLILGCFTPECKAALDALREELRRRDYLLVVIDFIKPGRFDTTEIVLLARMARFVVADISGAQSIPRELKVRAASSVGTD